VRVKGSGDSKRTMKALQDHPPPPHFSFVRVPLNVSYLCRDVPNGGFKVTKKEPIEFVKGHCRLSDDGGDNGTIGVSVDTGSVVISIFGSDPSIHILTQAIANNDIFYFPLDLFSVSEPRLYLIDTNT